MAVAGRHLTGRVAQLGSALPWHGRGPEFKSRHVHHLPPRFTSRKDGLICNFSRVRNLLFSAFSVHCGRSQSIEISCSVILSKRHLDTQTAYILYMNQRLARGDGL